MQSRIESSPAKIDTSRAEVEDGGVRRGPGRAVERAGARSGEQLREGGPYGLGLGSRHQVAEVGIPRFAEPLFLSVRKNLKTATLLYHLKNAKRYLLKRRERFSSSK